MKKLIFMLGIILSFVAQGFYMSPANFDKRIDNGEGYMEYRFPNHSKKTIRYKFSAIGGSENRKDMSKWVELYPKILTIRPEETGILKIFVDPPKDLKEGEYGFFLDAMPIEIVEGEKSENGEVKGASTIKIRASIELVGYVGNLVADLDLVKKKYYKKDGKFYLDIKLKNKTHKRGLSVEARIKGRNGSIQTEILGRLLTTKSLETTIELSTLEGSDPVEIEFVEEIDKKLIKKYKL